MTWYKSIGMKIVLSVVGMILIVNGALAWLFLGIQRENLNHAILGTASQLSETIKKSIQNDMLENRKEAAYKIMETIGRQAGIEKVRVYSSEGKILFSSDNTDEVGRMVNKRAEACYGCHSEARPLERLETSERSRIFFSRRGDNSHRKDHRVLGIINPMYNDSGCSAAECHAHPASQKVLGVIDVTMDLSEVDSQIARVRRQVLVVSLISVVAIFVIVAFILFHFLERPIKELVLGTKRISGGDLDHLIDVTSNDEMGHLATSFNQMTLDLQNAQKQIQEGIRTLENKVEERTRELKATQSQLLHSEKLAAVGALAATVAHEINNPLTGVYTYIRLMERKIAQGQYGSEEIDKFKGYLDTMRREVERTTAIVQNLLDFTRPKDPVRKAMSLVKVMEESLALISNKLKLANIEVVKLLNPLPEIQADPAHMKQVCLNLLINACEAMEEGGTLTIRSDYRPDTNIVTISVRDTGVGIEEKDRARIFDPFFSTKKKGTGLGLSVVNGIVTRHGGKVEIDSTPGKGTDFRVILPVG
ncbi:sensor histidine kinase [Candidatus Deferrimicrobium sp.]|uniref:sensor histidine kinase n=1 Tax=Candidatus Deferrimicrobium sp. TaxID=3060586 RepID=UPI002ED87E59